MEPVAAADVGECAVAPVLVADNDPNVSELLCAVLARLSIRTTCVQDGNTARERARRSEVRVVVCDLDMPGASGLEVVASLGELADPPSVIVISGFVDAQIEGQLAKSPFVRAVMRKPFDLLEFANVVRDLLAGAMELPEKGERRS